MKRDRRGAKHTRKNSQDLILGPWPKGEKSRELRVRFCGRSDKNRASVLQ